MKCYYEELNVPRDADDGEIKAAYKKLALRWHPDKNLADPERAKEQFQLVQQAYEVLSDRQERAWYDNHREQILHGANKDYEDTCLDVFQYFTSSCYKGFGDDDKSFYTVYRNVFAQIAEEDLEHMDSKEEFCSIPMFGTSESDYQTIVRPFYAYWMSYNTKRSYVWLDPYDIKETRERRVIKLIEKENKKVRAKAKRERNEEVRNLVGFVRKRDKRVQANIKQMEQKALENKQKSQDMAKQARRERHAESKKQIQAEWAKFDNVQDELENIEKQLAQEFNDHDDNSDASEDNDLYCVACNKVFKTVKAFANHESSKKHKENIDRLREEMIGEDNEYETIEDDISDDENADDEATVDNLEENDAVDRHDIDENMHGDEESLVSGDDDIVNELVIVKVKKKRNKKKNILPSGDDNVDIEEAEDPRKCDNKQKNVDDVTEATMNTSVQETLEISEEENKDDTLSEQSGVQTTQNGKKPKRRKEKKAKGNAKAMQNIPSTIPGDLDLEHTCVTCMSVFPSKNKLYDHLKKTGHGVYLPSSAAASSSSNKKGKNKREERRQREN